MNSSRCLTGPLIVLVMALVSLPAFAQVSISLDIAPPPLVVEDQPPCPDDGLVWTPGYWAYDDNEGVYYWVQGAWVQPPEVGLYWTPAYWGWNGNGYAFNEGYWGPSVGFYGGVNYGHGYWGNGYRGGRWDNGHFAYNTAANNVRGGRVHNTYADRSGYQPAANRVSYNGGQNGLQAQPTPQQQQVAQNRVQPTPQQQAHFQTAAQTRSHQVKVNARPVTANAAAPATPQAQGQAAQQAAMGQPHVEPQLTQQPAVIQPQANKPAGPLTGWDTQAQRQNPVSENQAAPVRPEPTANNQAKLDQQPHVVTEQPAQIKTEPAPNHEVKMDAQPHVASQPAPAPHESQGFGPAQSIPHQQQAAAPQMQHQAAAQAAPHIEAKPQAAAPHQPQANAGGQGKPGDQPGNGH
jgi:hypothetical protein